MILDLWRWGKARVVRYIKITPIIISFLFYKIYGQSGRNVITQGKGKYELNYTLNNRTYRIKLERKRGPSNIIRIDDCENDEDITEKVQEYLGPNEDFHGSEITPRMIHYYYGIRFFLRDDTILTFGPADIMRLPK